ncbi:MAG: hypothetical protein ACR2RB_19055 [Gammaproteobacteria bacterium]
MSSMHSESHTWLTEERVGPASPGSIAMCVVGALLIVAAINFLLPTNTNNVGYQAIESKWRMLLARKQPVDVLILGDSSCLQGVAPAVLNEELNVSSTNLCTTASVALAGDAWMLSTYLERFPPPTAVLITHTYDTWARDLRPTSLAMVPLSWDFWRRLQPRANLSAKEQVLYTAARYLPLYANNQGLARRIMYPSKRRTRQIDADGFDPQHDARPASVRRDTTEHREAVGASGDFRMSSINRRSLEHISELARDHQFDVFLISSPIYEGVFEDRSFADYYQEVQDSLATFIKAHPRLHFLLPEPVTFPATALQNVDHLTVSGAERFTRTVAAALRAWGWSEISDSA